jgi:uncharacterized repeat protein (TIGR01451 family)
MPARSGGHGDDPVSALVLDLLGVFQVGHVAEDLAVVKTVSNATPHVGANVTFTIAATNNGPGNATNVRVTDLLPQGLTFVSATPSTGTYNSNTGLWDIGTLNSGVTKQLQIVATVAVAGTRTNTATITGDVNDTNAGNNTSSASVTTAAATADLAVTKTASTTTPTVGSNVTFTITVTNNGPSAAQNARVTDVLPQGLTFVSATPTVGTYAQNTGLWTIGTLNSGATATLQIVATASTAGTVINTASGTSDVTDPSRFSSISQAMRRSASA